MTNPDKARQRIEWVLAANPEMRLATYDAGAPRLDCNCPAGFLIGERYPAGTKSQKVAFAQVRPEQLQEVIRGFEGELHEGGWAKLGKMFREHERFIG